MKNTDYPLYDTLPQITDLKYLIKSKVHRCGGSDALKFEVGKGEYCVKTYKELDEDIDFLGTYLYKAGLKNDHVAIIGENSYEWIISFLALTNGGNVAVPIDKELSAEDIAVLFKKSDCKAAIVAEKYIEAAKKAKISKIYNMAEMKEFLSAGKALLERGKRDFVNHNIDVEKMAAIFFTSGTTGFSKGVMLSHKNMAANINSACKNFLVSGNVFSVLPFHHTFGFITSILKPFNYEKCIFLNNRLKTVVNDLSIAKPQVLFLVPLFVENFYKNIWKTAKTNNKEKLLRDMMKISDKLLKGGIDLRKKLFASVHKAFGGRAEYIICGGAYLDEKYIKEFESWGIRILNGYGITECSPVLSVNRNHHRKEGSVGKILSGCDIQIAEDEEIIVKGDNVMLGYYKDKKATEAVLIDGWYHTGDLGYIEDGFLFIKGRKKNLIILSNGENVSPEELEAKILGDNAVCEAVVYSEDNVITAEIFPNEEYFDNTEYFSALIKRINAEMPVFKRIKKIKLRDEEFPKNTTKKIVRHKIISA